MPTDGNIVSRMLRNLIQTIYTTFLTLSGTPTTTSIHKHLLSVTPKALVIDGGSRGGSGDNNHDNDRDNASYNASEDSGDGNDDDNDDNDDKVRILRPDEYKAAAKCLAEAFAHDEVARYFIDTPDRRHWTAAQKWELHTAMFEYVTYAHCLKGLAITTGRDYACVALW